VKIILGDEINAPSELLTAANPRISDCAPLIRPRGAGEKFTTCRRTYFSRDRRLMPVSTPRCAAMRADSGAPPRPAQPDTRRPRGRVGLLHVHSSEINNATRKYWRDPARSVFPRGKSWMPQSPSSKFARAGLVCRRALRPPPPIRAQSSG